MHTDSSTDFLYRLWSGVYSRIFRRTSDSYPSYGGRGLTMFQPWVDSRDDFVAWILDNLGHRPQGRWSLDRIDNDFGYHPYQENGDIQLRWADQPTQCNNRRTPAQCAADNKYWIRISSGWYRLDELDPLHPCYLPNLPATADNDSQAQANAAAVA